jgi:hypothetical protein
MTDEDRPTESTTPAPAGDTDAETIRDPGCDKPAPSDPGDADQTIDKTDMSAVGDDGQVFGG